MKLKSIICMLALVCATSAGIVAVSAQGTPSAPPAGVKADPDYTPFNPGYCSVPGGQMTCRQYINGLQCNGPDGYTNCKAYINGIQCDSPRMGLITQHQYINGIQWTDKTGKVILDCKKYINGVQCTGSGGTITCPPNSKNLLTQSQDKR